MTESTGSTRLTTEQLAGAEASDGAPANPGTPLSPAGVTTADPRPMDGDAPGSVTIEGRRSRPASGEGSALLANNTEFMARWTAIQTTFVDEPRMAVEQADTLVAEVIRELARSLREGTRPARGRMVAGDRCLHRGSAAGAAAVSGLLPPLAAQLIVAMIHPPRKARWVIMSR